MPKRIPLLILILLTGLCAVRPAAPAEPRESEASGTVIQFDNTQLLLSVNTRLGRRRFQVTNRTLLLLNNHSATATDIQAGDRVEVTYRFDTGVASQIQLFREVRRQGSVRNVTATILEFRVGNGAALNLRLDNNTRAELADIRLTNRAVLVGLKATAVLEPGTLLALRVLGKTPAVTGTITAIDVGNDQITVSGPTPRVFTLDEDATLLRNGESATIDSLAVGDQVRVAFVKEAAGNRALAVSARSTGN